MTETEAYYLSQAVTDELVRYLIEFERDTVTPYNFSRIVSDAVFYGNLYQDYHSNSTLVLRKDADGWISLEFDGPKDPDVCCVIECSRHQDDELGHLIWRCTVE